MANQTKKRDQLIVYGDIRDMCIASDSASMSRKKIKGKTLWLTDLKLILRVE